MIVLCLNKMYAKMQLYGGVVVKFSWHEKEVPKGILTTQVYGVVFDKNGRVLLKVQNKNGNKEFGLAGGKPEKFDKNIEETLRREFIEEINTELESDVFYIGYQLVENDENKPACAQVRMTALIKEIGNKKPDADGGEIYDRLLTSPKKAISLLNWGEVGKQMIESAVETARQKLNIKFDETIEDLWI